MLSFLEKNTSFNRTACWGRVYHSATPAQK